MMVGNMVLGLRRFSSCIMSFLEFVGRCVLVHLVCVYFAVGMLIAVRYQGVPWLYPVEINSLAMRTKGAALGTASNWIANYIVVQITPTGIAHLGWRFYLIWMVFNALFVPVRELPTPVHLPNINALCKANMASLPGDGQSTS